MTWFTCPRLAGKLTTGTVLVNGSGPFTGRTGTLIGPVMFVGASMTGASAITTQPMNPVSASALSSGTIKLIKLGFHLFGGCARPC